MGKRIIKVLTCTDIEDAVFSLDLPDFKSNNCFKDSIYLVFEDGYLAVTPYIRFWFDTEYPDKELTDISAYFSEIIGEAIKEFRFNCRTVRHGTTHYCQPIATIEMESEKMVVFSDNFGDVEEENYAGCFEFSDL